MKHHLTRLLPAIGVALGLGAATPAKAGSDPFIGEIMIVGYTFCPRGWAEATGQILPITEYSALYSLYGRTFGGDGRTTFALPDLRGRVPVGIGRAKRGLPDFSLGSSGPGQKIVKSADGRDDRSVADPGFLAIRYCVALRGVYPSRN